MATVKLSGEVKVSLVTAACILALAIISKNVIHVQLDFISQYGPVWMFIVYIITRERAKESKVCGSTLFWSLAIALITVLVLIVYAI